MVLNFFKNPYCSIIKSLRVKINFLSFYFHIFRIKLQKENVFQGKLKVSLRLDK